MKCPSCHFDNPNNLKFCGACGTEFQQNCPQCDFSNPPNFKFCGKCGCELVATHHIELEIPKKIEATGTVEDEHEGKTCPEPDSERKCVTVLFSDLTGYTTMSEKLDPEEVKEITSRIFGEISKIVGKYNGFIEKYAGDAVMVIFGVPKAHEDDPIRAVKVAREIHELVDALSPEVENKIGQAISMHTGINTGLVVTGEVDMERGTHGVAGDTINVASRLSNLAKPGEILIDVATCRQVEGHFECEYLEETTVKGKKDPVQVNKVLSQRHKPLTIHRLSGLRADLIGRKVELAELTEAVENLQKGRGRIFSICGAAGTGKSRLVEEFKATLDLEQIQWIEGHAYAYTQNIPYFPLLDLLNRVLNIEENDPLEKVREKVESGIEYLVGKQEDIVPYVGGLYSLSYSEVENVSPEFWKSSLQRAIQAILSALAKRTLTIFFLEDLHWADPSFVELLRYACLEIRQPAIVLCAYRPIFSLFTSHQISNVSEIYHEIRLQDLSLSDAQDMLESLLKCETIPSDLKRLVQNKAEGNPFYLEELVNSLIESEILIRDNESWKIIRAISESDMSSSIHKLISGRLDRLEGATKRILQEASVIGRIFLYRILKRITELNHDIDRCLIELNQLDLIRARSLGPDLEYAFKHALTQEVVYSGLLKKERKDIHERIALIIEQLFKDRISEFSETIAFHYTQGQSADKAVKYLIISGEKSLKRYALEESHNHFKQAFEILKNISSQTKENQKILVDILIKWAEAFHFRGAYDNMIELFKTHENVAATLNEKESLGSYYNWLGFALRQKEKIDDSNKYLTRALQLGEDIENNKIIGYACAWLSLNYAEQGLFEKGIAIAKRAKKISLLLQSDMMLYRHALAGLGMNYYFMGYSKLVNEVGTTLIDNGNRLSDIRSAVLGNTYLGLGYLAAGDITSAIEFLRNAIQVSSDPFLTNFAKLFLGLSYASNRQIQDAEVILEEVMQFSKRLGTEIIGTPAQLFQSAVLLAKGNLWQGVKTAENSIKVFVKNDSKYRYATGNYILGQVFLQLVQRSGPRNLTFLVRNTGFLLKYFLFARKKTEEYFNEAIGAAKKIGAKGILGQSYFGLGLLFKNSGKKYQAKECLSEAIQLFDECEAEVYLKQAKEVLSSL